MNLRLMRSALREAAFAPEEAARALRPREGFAFLDSSMAGPESISLLACEPDAVIEGGSGDWDRLTSALAARAREGADLGVPDGAAIGWAAFDGSYCFGFYDRLHLFQHGSMAWMNPPALTGIPSESRGTEIPFVNVSRKPDFEALVRAAKEYIAAGDIYQVCLSHPFIAPHAGDAWPFYESLRRHSPAPFSAFLDLGGLQVASSSPECFLRLSSRRITTRPIKGTRPRRADPQLDQRNAYDLLTSAKEIAELVMITDLERNDLGRICDYGSVTVPELLKLESFEHVHHLVSTVSGTLRGDISHPEALRACLPGGSISGAPKSRALEIIRELESAPRGLYTGAIGYFGYNGESQFAIAIRTATFAHGLASFRVGAGIVADSDPEKEWQETLDKAAGLLQAARGP